MIINFSQQVDKKAIFLLFGCYCQNPHFVMDEKYSTNVNDYPENFHKDVYKRQGYIYIFLR